VNDVPAVHRAAPISPSDAALVVGAGCLVFLGYAAVSDVRIAALCLAATVVAAWTMIAFHRPRFALSASFSILLLAGTKFRMREADASLAGVLDAQIVMELALFGLIASGVLGVWLATSDGRRLSRAEVAVCAYASVTAASVLWSVAPAFTVVRAIQVFIVAAFAILAVRVLGPAPALWNASRALALHVLFFAVLGGAMGVGRELSTSSEGFRFQWFAVHPISVATLAGLGAVGLAGSVLFRGPAGQRAKPLAGIGLVILALTVVLVLTSSRGPMLALIAAAGALWLLKVRPALRVSAGLFAAAGVALLAIYLSEARGIVEWLANQDSALTRAFFRGQSADTVFELNGRLGLWDDLRPILFDHLILGYGYQASRGVLLDVAAWAAYAHNAFLQTALDLGLFGMLAILWLLGLAATAAFHRGEDDRTRATVVGLLVFVALNAMSTESFAAVPHVETLLLFLCAICAVSNRDSRRAAYGAVLVTLTGSQAALRHSGSVEAPAPAGGGL
jgi:hypothetical protein